METTALWVPVGSEGRQGGARNVPWDPGDGEAVSRRAAALLLSFYYGPLKESEQEFRRSRHRALQHRDCTHT